MTAAAKNSPDKASPAKLKQAREMAACIVEHHLGRRPRRLTPVSGGLSNFVFKARHGDGDLIIRLSPEADKINAYLKEQWAISKARQAGVPTPEVLEVGNTAAPFPYMISHRVEGREATSHPKRPAIVHEMGRLARLVHGVPTHGYGKTFDWSHNVLSRNDSWSEYLANEVRFEERLDILERNEMLSKGQITAVKRVFNDVAHWNKEPALNHGDLRLKNVLADEAGRVQAVIDWEECTSNVPPYWDLSIALHDLSIDEKQHFLDGYGLSADDVRDMAPIVKAINLINYAPYVGRMAAAKEAAALERYRVRLSGALDLYCI